MNLLKNMKFQLALVALITAIILRYAPDIDEESLVNVVTAFVALILGGHGVVEWRGE